VFDYLMDYEGDKHESHKIWYKKVKIPFCSRNHPKVAAFLVASNSRRIEELPPLSTAYFVGTKGIPTQAYQQKQINVWT
jgi:hypothetical protein